VREETHVDDDTTEPTEPDEGTGVAEHLENSKRLAAQAHEGWERLPTAHEADDAHHPGAQGQQVPSD
jgi:hypothetical protein